MPSTVVIFSMATFAAVAPDLAAIALAAMAGGVVLVAVIAGAAIKIGDVRAKTQKASAAAIARLDGRQNLRAVSAGKKDFILGFITSFPYGKLKIWAW